jgi:stage III sporulation protein AE
MIGGFLKDGFDLVVAGSILIKNSIGVATLVYFVYSLLSPVIQIVSFLTVLNLLTSFIEPIADSKITDLCSAISKGVTMILVCLLFVAFMFFITTILMVLTANSFI